MMLRDKLKKEIKDMRENQEKDMLNINSENNVIAKLTQTHILIQGTLGLFYNNIIDLVEDIEKGMSEFEKSIRLMEVNDEMIKYLGYLADEQMRARGIADKVDRIDTKEFINYFVDSIKEKDRFIESITLSIVN